VTDHIKIENDGGILSLTMARSEKKNALTNAMYGALADAIEGAETDADVRVVLIRGEGNMFTAGNDVSELAAIAAGGSRAERHVSRFLEALARSSRPLVAPYRGAPSVSAPRCCCIAIWRAGRECPAFNAVRQFGVGAGSGLEPVDAAPYRLCLCL
jgi:1,4-dihydroxy-2-naphthoyl-CoA synthase